MFINDELDRQVAAACHQAQVLIQKFKYTFFDVPNANYISMLYYMAFSAKWVKHNGFMDKERLEEHMWLDLMGTCHLSELHDALLRDKILNDPRWPKFRDRAQRLQASLEKLTS